MNSPNDSVIKTDVVIIGAGATDQTEKSVCDTA